jgi:hypothetical protein
MDVSDWLDCLASELERLDAPTNPTLSGGLVVFRAGAELLIIKPGFVLDLLDAASDYEELFDREFVCEIVGGREGHDFELVDTAQRATLVKGSRLLN